MLAEFKFKYDSPIVCAAIHNGHELSLEVKKNIAVSEEIRLKEEDPYTERFTRSASNTIIGRKSRFEVDVNRAVENCIYLEPKDAWGLSIRKNTPAKAVISKGRKEYNDFYDKVKNHLAQLEKKFGYCFIFDVHSYNYHRAGAEAEFDNPNLNPDIIIGTSNMPRKWFPLIDDIANELLGKDYYGKPIDLQLNIKFPGGRFPRWIHKNFPHSACCMSIEFKKSWMDEWTGEIFDQRLEKLIDIFESTFSIVTAKLSM